MEKFSLKSLLESNNFDISNENLSLLEENLFNNIFILDSSDIVLTEGMDEDYVYMQLLDNNGFEVTEHNIDVLKEAIDNGHILLAEADLNKRISAEAEKRKKRKATKKKVISTALKIAAGALLGTGLGAASNGLTKAITSKGIAGLSTATTAGIGAAAGAAGGALKSGYDNAVATKKAIDKKKSRYQELCNKAELSAAEQSEKEALEKVLDDEVDDE